MSDIDKVLEKVKKLLSLSGNNPSEQEAISAFMKTQELLVKHNLSMADLKEIPAKEIIHSRAHKLSVRIPWWYKSLGVVIANNFKCHIYQSNFGGRTGSVITFMGVKDDTEIAIELFQYAVKFISYQCQLVRRKVRKQGRDTDGVANDYISGFISGMKNRFEEQLANNETWALVLVKDKDVEDAWTKDSEGMTTSTKTETIKRRFDAESYTSGYKHGNAFGKPVGEIDE